jgi:hydroxyacylglutathione hydrolase
VAVETVGDGDRCEFPDLGLGFDILHVPGHTLSHIAFFGHGALFCGDTLFSAGCGRMFEGTPRQMWASLSRLRDLPPETLMYCGHEYTAADLPSLPSPLSLERCVNPFLRCDVPQVRQAAVAHAGRPLPGDDEVFGTLRAWKDQFR